MGIDGAAASSWLTGNIWRNFLSDKAPNIVVERHREILASKS